MLPQINILGKEIGMYALFGILGVLVAGWLFCRLLICQGHSDSDALMLLVFAGIGSALGSHFLYGLTNIHHWNMLADVSSAKEALFLLGKSFGGGVFYGGLLGGLAASFWYIKRKKLDLMDYSDCGAVCIPLFHSFARIGCFFAGCCYGIEVEWGIASAENPYIHEVVGIRRFPTQLLEATLNFVLFLMLLALKNKKNVSGRLIYLYLLSYSVIRFCVEFLRGDAVRGIWLGISTSQWISVFIFAVSSITLFYMVRKGAKQNRTDNF